MYISEIELRNYRCFRGSVIEFNKGLNVLIGENNSGKTTVLKALKFFFDKSNTKRPSIDDFYKGINLEEEIPQIDIIITLKETDGEKPEEKALITTWITKLEKPWEAKLSYSFFLPESEIDVYNREIEDAKNNNKDLWTVLYKFIPKYVQRIYGGNFDSKNRAEHEYLEKFDCEVLDALRDVEREMFTGKDTLLKNVLNHFLDYELKETKKIAEIKKEQQKFEMYSTELVNHLKSRLNDKRILELAKKTGASVGGELKINGELKESDVIAILTLIIENGFGFKVPITSNGLGYNNLIYISLVLSNLDIITSTELGENAKIFPIILIEEPEAHLHPALQYNFLSFINDEIRNNSISKQIFITTHSTHITAAVDLDSIICMMQTDDKQPVAKYPGKVFAADKEEDIKSKKYIERFLDATKSNMLFSKGVILVEGLAEQLIVPCLSKSIKMPFDEKHVSVVQVGNKLPVFEHFCKMFGVGIKNDNKKYALTTKLACIVDTDPTKIDRSKEKPRWKKCWPYEKEENIEYQYITKSIVEFEKKIKQSATANVNLFYNNSGKGKTFEYDLAFENPDSELLKDATDEIVLDDEIEKMIKNSGLSPKDQNKATFATKYLISVESSKGEAGLDLSYKLKQNNEKEEKDKIPFVVPTHVSDAVKWACGEVIQNE